MPSTAGVAVAPACHQLHVKFTPRPHVTIRLLGRLMSALLDTGSKISIINAETAQRGPRYEDPLPGGGRGNSSCRRHESRNSGTCFAPRHGTREDPAPHVQHPPYPRQSDIDRNRFVGTPRSSDIAATAPTLGFSGKHEHALAGMTPHDPNETARLQDFLRELAAFEHIQGPTDKIEHTIRVKTDQ